MGKPDNIHVLLAGETWIIYETHIKGFDSFTVGKYGEGAKWITKALRDDGIEVTHIKNHDASVEFPTSMDALREYDVVLLSDIGSNTLTLHPDTAERSMATPNRLELLREYTREGGGLIMIGGWMSFQGFGGRAHYKNSPVEEALPVTMMPADDRVEIPQGICPMVVTDHPIVAGLPDRWPNLLSYNRVFGKPDAQVLATIEDEALLTVHGFGAGRAVAFAADCAPHGAPPEFLEWEHYGTLWSRIVRWAASAL